MLKKYTKIQFLTLLSLMMLFACKKEVEIEVKQFGVLNLDNQTTYKNINLRYNGLSGITLTSGVNSDIKIPAGSGKLSFLDESNQSFLEIPFNIESHKVKDLLLFQPAPELKPFILENNQAEEPKPEKGNLKIKAANFAPHAFPKSIDLVFFQEDPDTFDPIVTDTLKNVPTTFMDFKKVAVLFPDYVSIGVLDSETKQLLSSRLTTINTSGKNIFTIYIVESLTEGTAVGNSPYKYSIKVLFAN